MDEQSRHWNVRKYVKRQISVDIVVDSGYLSRSRDRVSPDNLS